jgi:elongation factor 1-beta
MSSYTITDESHLTTLDNQLKDNLYIGGNQPSAEDALVFEQFVNANTEPNQDKHVNLWSWYALVTLFENSIRESWKQVVPAQKVAEKKAAPKKEEAPKKEAPKDECDDLFGDDGEDNAAALEALKKKKDEGKKKEKPAVIAKSIILLEVKVWDPEQNLDELASRIIKVSHDGLVWKTEYKLADVAFGVKKIIVGCVVEDEKVSVDDIIDELQGWEDDIQSVDILSFNKI